eukprot:scaffold33569_cov84-Skeletonema_dohrnii-CCMP3373.AAC.3
MASTRLSRAYDAASSSQSKMIAGSITIDDMNVVVSPFPTPAVKRTDTKEQQITFPHKLYEMLEYACDSEFNSACSWSADGSSFAISNRNVMMEELVPMFFRQIKFRSFTRQLNLWGFVRTGTTWRHTCELFHREKKHLLKQMRRIAVKSRGSSTATMTCDPPVDSSPTHVYDSATKTHQSPVNSTPIAIGSVFEYFSKSAINLSIQEAVDLAADFSRSVSSDETAATQDQEEDDGTKTQTNEEMMHTEAANTMSCTNDDLLCLAASIFERKDEEDKKDMPSTLR